MSDVCCPYCGKTLQQDGDIFYCPTHKIGYSFTEYNAYTLDSTPKYIIESCQLLQEIIEGRVWMSYGPADLFDEDFKLENTVMHRKASDVGKHRFPQAGDVFISHNKYVSRYLKPEIMSNIILNDQGQKLPLGKYDVDRVSHLLLSELAYNQMDFTLTERQSRAATAYIADSSVLTACTLLKETPYSIESFSNSGVLMSYLYCGIKDLDGVFTSRDILDTLRDSVLEFANYCTLDNLTKRRSEIQFSEYVQHMSIPQAQGLLRVDFSPERELIPGNEWVFWRGDVVQNCSQLIKECSSDAMLTVADTIADLYRSAYKQWGAKYNLAKKYLNKAKSLVGEKDPSLLYITYWNILSERMEKELLP